MYIYSFMSWKLAGVSVIKVFKDFSTPFFVIIPISGSVLSWQFNSFVVLNRLSCPKIYPNDVRYLNNAVLNAALICWHLGHDLSHKNRQINQRWRPNERSVWSSSVNNATVHKAVGLCWVVPVTCRGQRA